MNNEDIYIYDGSSLDLTATTTDEDYVSIALRIGEYDGTPIADKEANFIDFSADLSFPLSDYPQLTVGSYKYQFIIIRSDGTPKILPEPDQCGEVNELPNFIVLESLPNETISA